MDELPPTLRRRTALALMLAAAAATPAAASVSAPSTSGRKAGDLEIETRELKTADGETVKYELGVLYVPENRGEPGSRLISIGFARVKALKPGKSTPVFALPGGPGGSYLGLLLGPYKDQMQLPQSDKRLKEFLRYRAVGDVIFMDQRGASAFGERLNFAFRPTDRPLDKPADIDADIAETIALAKVVVAQNRAADLRGYSVLECAEDVNALRAALGYEKINLLGQSFGSQWSFAVLRKHPEIVARAILSGVEPLNYGYDMPSHIFASFQRIAYEADQDPGLAPYLPKGGIMAAVRAVRKRLAKEPVTVEIKDKSGAIQKVVVGLGDFQQAFMQGAASWPAGVLTLYHGHYEPLAMWALQDRKGSDAQAALIIPLIDSSLNVTPARRHLLETDSGTEFLGQWNFETFIASSDIWPTADVGDDFREPVQTKTPVVFVHGDWDLSTPIENTLNMLPYFPNGRAVLVHRGPHDSRFQLSEQQPEVTNALVGFLATGDTKALPTRTEIAAPKFAKPAFPPPSAG